MTRGPVLTVTDRAQPVERYVSFDVHSSKALMSAIDAFNDGGIMDGCTRSLWVA